MSLIEMMLANREIMLAAGLALGPLVIAIVLWLVLRLRSARARRRFLAAQRRQAALEAHAGLPIVAEEPDEERVGEAAPRPAVSLLSAAGEAAEGGDGPSPSDDEVAPAMQNILSAVFADEEQANPYEALLAELGEVDGAEIVALCDQIASRLHTSDPASGLT